MSNSKTTSLADYVLKPIYRIYEKRLYNQIKNYPMPVHIGIIPDGNRRWADKHGYDYFIGHKSGYEKMQDVLEWIWELGIKVVTIYAMSTENCTKRSPTEREHLFNLMEKAFEELIHDRRIHDRQVKVKVIGNLSLVPEKALKKAREAEAATSHYNERLLNVAICYGGRHEILEAIKKVAREYKDGKIDLEKLDEEMVRNYLFTKESPDPDLIIRTSGEERISNFLLWQSAYSELYFTDVYWPDFRKIDLWRAIRCYQKRKRNFGK